RVCLLAEDGIRSYKVTGVQPSPLPIYRRARRLSARPSPGSEPRRRFLTCAVCHVRRTTSPTRPIACESEPIIEIAPRSWRMSSEIGRGSCRERGEVSVGGVIQNKEY